MRFLILPLLALVTTTQAADLPGDFKGPLGLQLYTLRESFKTNVPATLDKAKELGFTEIEGGGDYGLGIEKFNALLHERGLKMASAGFGYESLKKDIGAAVRRAQAFGAKFAMCAWIPHKGDFTAADVHRAATDFNSGARRSRLPASRLPIIRMVMNSDRSQRAANGPTSICWWRKRNRSSSASRWMSSGSRTPDRTRTRCSRSD